MISDSLKTLGREDFLRLFADAAQILVSNNPTGDTSKATSAEELLNMAEIIMPKHRLTPQLNYSIISLFQNNE